MLLAVEFEREPDIFVRHGLALDLFGDRHVFRALGLHELQTGGGSVEQVGQFDARTMFAAKGRGPNWRDDAAIDADIEGAGFAWLGGNVEPRHRSHGGQGFAAEPECLDMQQVPATIGLRFELGSGVALDGQLQVFLTHAGAIVLDQDTR